MVSNVVTFSWSGLTDWIIQRVSAVIMTFYILIFTFHLFMNPQMSYSQWVGWIQTPWMRYTTLLFVLSLVMHAWIGMWTIITDYIKPALVRGTVHAMIIFVLFVSMIWSVEILWGF